jgi:N-acetyl-1-D-myo-inositol-2-amino-2-deoxy-alpha-D-glucopyranoside deacetylase
MNKYQKQCILAIMAHPDDETFGIGGTLAYYADQGIPIHLICATRGEVGEVAPKFLENGRSVADVRTAELECAANVLGISSVKYLGFRDSGMPGMDANMHPMALIRQPEDDLIKCLITWLEKIEPSVVITFDQIGGYPHPDHIFLHKVVTKAFIQWIAKRTMKFQPKLVYYTISRRIIRWMVKLYPLFGKDPKKFGINSDIDLTSISDTKNQVEIILNYQKVKRIRRVACSCYASQGGDQINRGVEGLLRGWEPTQEYFELAYPKRKSRKIIRDLFCEDKYI